MAGPIQYNVNGVDEAESTALSRASRKERIVVKTLLYLFLAMMAMTMVIPLLWMLATSLKVRQDIVLSELQFWPPLNRIQWSNYIVLFELDRTNFNLNYWNSMFVASVVMFGHVLTSAMAGYAFSRLHWRWRDQVFLMYLMTLMIPVTVTMLPVFLILKNLRLLDTYAALTLPLMFNAYGTFLCRQFMLGLPRDLEEAAEIDGCGYIGIFTNVILPLSTPVLATLGILSFMGAWGNFTWPLVATFSEDLWVLPLALYGFQSQFDIQYNFLMAASMLAILPILIVFIIGQRFLIEGIQLGAVKG